MIGCLLLVAPSVVVHPLPCNHTCVGVFTTPVRSLSPAVADYPTSHPHAAPPGVVTEEIVEFDDEAVARQFDVLQLAVYHRRGATGFEESKELSLSVGSLVAGRYRVLDYLGSAAFSNAVQAADLKTGGLVCLKIVKVRERGNG